MWIFSTPKTYSEMVEKISKSVFVLSLFGLYILSCANEDFLLFMESISLGGIYTIFGLKICLALFYAPLAIGILEHIFKLHDKISFIFKIRFRYDKNYILKTFCEETKIKYDLKSADRETINTLMGKVFYKYASSTKPVIDSHNIILALNEWCWFWIMLDSFLIIVLIGVPFLIVKWSLNSLLLLIVCLLILIMLMESIMLQNMVYTNKEILEILKDVKRKEKINNALQGK